VRLRVLRLVALSRALALGLTATFGTLLVAAACGSRASPVGPGGECFLATDCAPGLICVEQSSKARICSDDLSRVAGRSPPDAGAEEADTGADAAASDASRPDSTSPPNDSGGTADTGASPDTGAPVDSGGD